MFVLGSNFNICYTTTISTYGWSGWTGRDEWGNPYALLDTNSKKGASSPLYFLYGGYVNNGSLNDAGSGGFYWSSTANSATQAYDLYFYSGGVFPSSNGGRYFGYSIRCVAR